VIRRLLEPWRNAGRTWRTLVHVVLDLPMSIVAFTLTITLLSISLGLAVVLPVAVPFVWLLFVVARGIGRVERSRLNALLDLDLDDPIPPFETHNPWRRFKARLTSKPRWKEIAYGLLSFPIGTTAFVITVGCWALSFALLLLPLYVKGLPDDTAHFHFFAVSQGSAALAAAIGGLIGLVAIAPWVTIIAGRIDAAVARWLLAPPPANVLVEQVQKAETGRAAAIDSAEAERRRIERDLHDGAQQRLVALAMDLGAAKERFDTDPDGAKALVTEAHEEAKAALKEIRDLVRGIHPVILEDRGLDAALSAVVARSPIPVELTVELAQRPSPSVESAAYFVVSEALTNIARHANATKAHVGIVQSGDRLIVEVRDDGVGGADPAGGSGLTGLADRVVSMGGTMDLLSPAGGPTTVLVELPCAS
jgi:signal transduction histidine kinase